MNLIKKTWQGIKTEPKLVREFGFILAGFLLIVLPLAGNLIGIVFFHESFRYPNRWPVLSAIALVVNLALPGVMALMYRIAMLLATGIGWVVMRVVLFILFYLVFTPMSLVAKLIGKDFLDQKISREAKSYWKTRLPKRPREDYERLF